MGTFLKWRSFGTFLPPWAEKYINKPTDKPKFDNNAIFPCIIHHIPPYVKHSERFSTKLPSIHIEFANLFYNDKKQKFF